MSVSPVMSNVIQIVLLSTILLSLTAHPTQAKDVVPFRTNLELTFKEWRCKDPKPRLVYLGKYHLQLQSEQSR